MKEQITYDAKQIININRDALHRELRNVLAEQNVTEEYRIYLEMLEDMFTIAKTADSIFKLLDSLTLHTSLNADTLTSCRSMISGNDELLEKWEQLLLHKR